MRDFERRQHLLDHNEWWKSPTRWEQRDPDLREARLNPIRSYDPRPLDDLEAGSLYLLMGPRRAGKSVAVKRAIVNLCRRGVDPRRITFCPCEGLTAQDLRRVIKLAIDLTPGIGDDDRYWFFDEITFVSKWVETLKQLRDQTALRTGCVVATGSSGATLRGALGGLGGREGPSGGVRLLLPMGFRAFVHELYPDLASNLPTEQTPLSDIQTEVTRRYLNPLMVHVDDVTLAWERYLTIGGFPRAVADALEGVDVCVNTASGFWNILIGDILHVRSMSERDVKALLRRLVEGIGAPLNVASVAQKLSIGSYNTVEDRISRLAASFYIWRVSTTRDGVKPVEGGQSKLYFIDPLIARLPSLRDKKIPEPDITYMSEQQVGMCLQRATSRTDLLAIMDEAALLVRRNPDSGSEIDYVGGLLGAPVESKYVSQKWKPERHALEEHYHRGIVATRDILDLTDDIWAVPAGLLAWMVDD